jgi:predicted PolB exonuclease-like 3'-5' exonuclease
MSELNEMKTNKDAKNEMPILQLNRLSYTKINGKILEATNDKLEKYIAYASERMKTDITSGDCIEHGLRLLFDRDTGFKEWLKRN